MRAALLVSAIAALIGLGILGGIGLNAQTPPQPVPREQLSAPLTPEEFIRRAAQEAMGDSEIGRMVRSDATLPHALQILGQQIADRANSAGEELRVLAERHNVPLTGQLTAEDSKAIQDLSRIQGTEFTELYLERMMTTLDRHVRLHERALEIDAPDIRQYAERTLPVLREQHAAAQSVWDQEIAEETEQ